jgi:UDP-2,3-diacylglucosamine pyrophosphatase LpxH
MERRNFLNMIISASAGIGLSQYSSAAIPERYERKILRNGTFSIDDNRISYFLDDITTPLKIIQITDTHLWMDDQRGEPFKQYSHRMAKAYNITKHFRTGEDTNPAKSFEEVLELAVKKNADLLALTGDIFSFPSELAIEWAYRKLSDAGIPYVYIAGNHDWHYEGMEGSSKNLRDIWTKKRLSLLYEGNDPMMVSRKIKDINVLLIDNSTYEIMPEQLEFFRKHSRAGEPFILMMHIPLYAPGRSMGYGCGNPLWGRKSDTSFELEGRERWPESGPSEVTMDFCKEVFSSRELIGIFAGHVHQQSIDIVRGTPQFCARANATGAFLEIDFRKT